MIEPRNISEHVFRFVLWLEADWLRSAAIIAGTVILFNVGVPKLAAAWRQVTDAQRRRAFNAFAFAAALSLLILYNFRPKAEFHLALRSVCGLFFLYSAACWLYELAFYARRGWDFSIDNRYSGFVTTRAGQPISNAKRLVTGWPLAMLVTGIFAWGGLEGGSWQWMHGEWVKIR